MKISSIKIYRYYIPFTAPMRIGKQVLDMREGFILELRTDNGSASYGEIAPLPGLDNVSLDQCRGNFSFLYDYLIRSDLHFDRFNLSTPFLGIISLPEGRELPAWTNHTWFGVECALMELFLQQNNFESNYADLLSWPLFVPVNGLFIPDVQVENASRQIIKLKEQGVQTIKVKIGRMAADEEISQIRNLARQLGEGVAFRFDGNRNLTPELYRRYYDALHDLNVEYAEEPLSGGDWAKALAVPWPVALDESLERILDSSNPRPSLINPMVNTIIPKPGLLTGLHGMARCVADARTARINTVLSSSFNTGITLAALGIFSRFADIPSETAHGLDTLRYLECDVLTSSPEISKGKLVIPDLFKTNELNHIHHSQDYLCHSREGGNPVKKELVPRIPEDDAWIPDQARNDKKEGYENIPESFTSDGQILNASVIRKVDCL